jgi:hypothetical protein
MVWFINIGSPPDPGSMPNCLIRQNHQEDMGLASRRFEPGERWGSDNLPP